MTIKELLKKAGHRLRVAEIDHPDADAELLLAHALDRPREFLITHPEKTVTQTQVAKFERLLERRKAHEPIAYLLGYREFYGRAFAVNADVLIPRSSTETLIEVTLGAVSDLSVRADTICVLDVGTGSGCIALTLAAELPGARAVGIDVSKGAIGTAIENARRFGLEDRVTFLLMDIASPSAEPPSLPPHGTLILTANLPYLPDFSWDTRSRGIREHEPMDAFISGADGLDHYRALLRRLGAWKLAPDILLFEADPPQFAPLANIVQGALRDHRLTVHKDLQGLDRILLAVRR